MGGRGTRYAAGKENCIVLDFARNVERLGPIDDPRIPDRKEKDEEGERPRRRPDDMKSCPECATYMLASASYCAECGHVFETEPPAPKHGAVASDAEIMSPDLTWLDVAGASARAHHKDGSPPSLKILYRTATGDTVAQWLALQHPRARSYAERKWRDLGGQYPIPITAAEALQRMGELRRPAKIGVKRTGRFWQVERVRHSNAG
jgi:DNA repair protein RadD